MKQGGDEIVSRAQFCGLSQRVGAKRRPMTSSAKPTLLRRLRGHGALRLCPPYIRLVFHPNCQRNNSAKLQRRTVHSTCVASGMRRGPPASTCRALPQRRRHQIMPGAETIEGIAGAAPMPLARPLRAASPEAERIAIKPAGRDMRRVDLGFALLEGAAFKTWRVFKPAKNDGTFIHCALRRPAQSSTPLYSREEQLC